MTSTPTPPPNYSSLPAPKPDNNNKNHNHRNSHKPPKNRLSSSSRSACLVSVAAAEFGANGSAGTAGAVESVGKGSGRAAFSSALDSLLNGRKSGHAPEFSGRRSTRFAAKMHSGMPRVTVNKHAHSNAADEALHCLLKAGNNIDAIDNVLISYEQKLWEVEDYIYMLKEFGNTGHFLLAIKCFDFIIWKQKGRVAKGKIVNTMIGTLGKLGEINLALRLFESARYEGHGNTVYSFSAMISAYGRNGYFHDAVDMFKSMRSWGIEPDLISYNALIDAGAKAEADFDVVVKFYDEMLADGIVPDRLTYNSLLSVCAPKGMCKMAEKLLREMDNKGIVRDLFTYNTYLDTLCKGSQFNSFEDASELLNLLRLFNNKEYGITHGLLMGYRDQVWFRAQNLFDEIMHMDSSTASAFYNALTDFLWHFGQRRGAEMVAIEGRRQNVWKAKWSNSCLDLHLMSVGAACAMVHAWLLNLHSTLFKGSKLPKTVSILTGWGKRSKVMGNGTLKKAVEAHLNAMGSPFRVADGNLGRLVCAGDLVATWLRIPGIYNLLVLHDVVNHSQAAAPSHDNPALEN